MQIIHRVLAGVARVQARGVTAKQAYKWPAGREPKIPSYGIDAFVTPITHEEAVSRMQYRGRISRRLAEARLDKACDAILEIGGDPEDAAYDVYPGIGCYELQHLEGVFDAWAESDNKEAWPEFYPAHVDSTVAGVALFSPKIIPGTKFTTPWNRYEAAADFFDNHGLSSQRGEGGVHRLPLVAALTLAHAKRTGVLAPNGREWFDTATDFDDYTKRVMVGEFNDEPGAEGLYIDWYDASRPYLGGKKHGVPGVPFLYFVPYS